MSNNSNFAAARCRDAVFHTTQTPTVCYSVPSIVEVSGGCQSVNIMSAQPRVYCSEIICILRKIHRLRKHPWISAQTMDDNGSIDCAGRSMDCADPQIAPNTYMLLPSSAVKTAKGTLTTKKYVASQQQQRIATISATYSNERVTTSRLIPLTRLATIFICLDHSRCN